MKDKIIRLTFSILAGFGLTILIFIGLMFLLFDGFKLESEYAFMIFGITMGTIAFSVLSARIYFYLKKS
jgi:hypothetical protein